MLCYSFSKQTDSFKRQEGRERISRGKERETNPLATSVPPPCFSTSTPSNRL